ncbi:MAG: hypothetical protein ACJ8J7_16110 [Sulfurifustaceae bacterium]
MSARRADAIRRVTSPVGAIIAIVLLANAAQLFHLSHALAVHADSR